MGVSSVGASGEGELNCDVHHLTAQLPTDLSTFRRSFNFGAPRSARSPPVAQSLRVQIPHPTYLPAGSKPAAVVDDVACAQPRLEGPGLAAAYDAAPEPCTELPLITMIQGRFFKPLMSGSKRKSVSCASKKANTIATAYSLARDSPLIPAGTGRARSRPGITMQGEEQAEPVHTSAEARRRAELNEVERTVSIFTHDMAQALLPFSEEERRHMRAESEEQLTDRIRTFISSKSSHLASMSNARRALLALYDFAASVGVVLRNFQASVGLVSAFLSSQTARSMAASRLQGLKWAQLNYSLSLQADAPALRSFLEVKTDGSNHASTIPVKVACHLAVVAADKTQHLYLRAVASGVHMMIAASLRWADAQRASWSVMSNCIEGKGPTKVGYQYWWGERQDFLGGDSWFKPLLASYKGLTHPPDFIFRRASFKRGHSGEPEFFEGWSDGPAVKLHVIETLIHILMLTPMSLTREEALAYVRLHGARRVYPTLARFLSGTLQLTLDDRQEMGRWAPATGGDRAERRGAMANRYATDAERARCVKTRSKVATATRNLIKDHGWRELPMEGGGYEAFITQDVIVEEPEPDLSSDESDVEVE